MNTQADMSSTYSYKRTEKITLASTIQHLAEVQLSPIEQQFQEDYLTSSRKMVQRRMYKNNIAIGYTNNSINVCQRSSHPSFIDNNGIHRLIT